MTRINLANRNTETRNTKVRNHENRKREVRNSVSWGKAVRNNSGPLIFAAVLIVCSLAVGCSSEKPQSVTSNHPAAVAPPSSNTVTTNTMPTPLPEAKPAPKKIVHKRPATVTYTDKTYGVSFDYPRRYAIETGDAAKSLLVSSPQPMNFVQSGGVALAAVELPETGFANTDFSSAFFNVSVNNTLTADQCTAFSVPQPKLAVTTPATDADSKQPASTPVNADSQSPRLMLGDLEMHSAEAVSGEGTSQSDSKYFHVFQNGACYEFALNVTTNAAQADASLKHIDRDKIFSRLQSILSTVKIDPITADPEKTVAEKNNGEKIEAPKVDTVQPEAAKPAPDGTDATKSTASTPETAPRNTAAAPAPESTPVASTQAASPATNTPPQ